MANLENVRKLADRIEQIGWDGWEYNLSAPCGCYAHHCAKLLDIKSRDDYSNGFEPIQKWLEVDSIEASYLFGEAVFVNTAAEAANFLRERYLTNE